MIEVFDACVAAVPDTPVRTGLLADRARVIDRCAEYEMSAPLHRLNEVLGEPSPEGLDVYNAMVDLYEDHMVKVDGVQRYVYLGVKGRSDLNRCPFCLQRDVSTLDHYLPKTTFPEFSVFPLNLVPSCSMCNQKKLDWVAAVPEQLLFHPYYDFWDSYPLLRASIHIGNYVDIEFYIDADAAPEEVARRAAFHFAKLELNAIYASYAASELRSRKRKFQSEYLTGGAGGLQRDLAEEAASCAQEPNTWRRALYLALSESIQFVELGFEAIED